VFGMGWAVGWVGLCSVGLWAVVWAVRCAVVAVDDTHIYMVGWAVSRCAVFGWLWAVLWWLMLCAVGCAVREQQHIYMFRCGVGWAVWCGLWCALGSCLHIYMLRCGGCALGCGVGCAVFGCGLWESMPID